MTVFLSYHNSKQDVVEHLSAYLLRAGIPSWFAPRDIAPGATWDTAIADAIRQSRALVLLFCKQADASQHVKRELHLADRHGIPVYWVRLERVEPERLGYFLSSTQWIDWLDNRDATLESLVADLNRLEERREDQGPCRILRLVPQRPQELLKEHGPRGSWSSTQSGKRPRQPLSSISGWARNTQILH